jgi:molecular chaperone GrpE
MVGHARDEKKSEIRSQLDALKKEMDENSGEVSGLLEKMRYLQADFENYRKNLEKEKAHIVENANEALIRELLQVNDDLERAAGSMESEKDRKGMALLHRNLFKILEKNGLKKIESVGKRFDPYYHECLLKEKSDREEGTILEEIQSGYMLNSKVIRHSKVKIAGN